MSLQKSEYFRHSRGIVYSYIACLPLLVLYEVLIRISQAQADYLVRISVDVWFKAIFQAVGLNALSATFLVAAIVGAIIIFTKRKQLPQLKKNYLGLMFIESAFYAIILGYTIGIFLEFLLHISSGNPIEQLSKFQLFALSLGAGLYEELFFRVILVSGLFYLINYFAEKKNVSYILAAIIAALLFSAVHYVGEFGDFFTVKSFLFRFLFGLALNVVYVIRGFGIAAWTHALYDLIVIANM
ncbi:MAG: CPBP family intramembrane metalloprotease [Balneolaceae bacterium]|nr:MAG: CPBP family intramembrane metalloprotease [Balneolaceae bacterium]